MKARLIDWNKALWFLQNKILYGFGRHDTDILDPVPGSFSKEVTSSDSARWVTFFTSKML